MLGGADALKMVRFAAFAADSLMTPSEEPRRRLIERKGELLTAAAAAAVVIAGWSYWIGMRSARVGSAPDRAVVASDRSFRAMHMPQPVVAQPLALAPPRPSTSQSNEIEPAGSAPVSERMQAPAANEMNGAGTEPAKAAEAAAPRESSGAADSKLVSAMQKTKAPSDQMVRIGRFATEGDAEKGWATVLHQWPGMQSLPVVRVQINSLRDGKTYYRLQVGTTSRAHSEVLCRRAHDLDQSCTVIGSDEKSGEGPL